MDKFLALSDEDKNKVIGCYKELLQDAENGEVYRGFLGICANVSYKLDTVDINEQDFDAYYDVVFCYYEWPTYSGDDNSPVEGRYVEPKWEGTQLELRISLLKHIIKSLEELV